MQVTRMKDMELDEEDDAKFKQYLQESKDEDIKEVGSIPQKEDSSEDEGSSDEGEDFKEDERDYMYDINDFVADSGKFHPNVTNMQIVGLDSSSGYSGQRIMF